jgi:hypothetical protein
MIQIAFKGIPIGQHCPLGKCLEKAPFRALRPTDRLRAYLLMVYPQSRSRVCLGRVTGIPHRAVVAYLQQDLKAGRIIRTEPGRYQVVPINPRGG